MIRTDEAQRGEFLHESRMAEVTGPFVVPDLVRIEISHDDRSLSRDKVAVALDPSYDCLDVMIIEVGLRPNSKEQERYRSRYLYWGHEARHFLWREWRETIAG
jgi:hypothetical protein